MADVDLAAARELLRVAAEAGPEEITRAYHRMRSLYAEDSLATYSLLDAEARAAMLDRIEAAYHRLLEACEAPVALPAGRDGPPEPPREPAPDPAAEPGAFLRWHRRKKGLSLAALAKITKVGTTHLANIEAENFAELPVRVYLRGFLIAYGQAVGVPDPEAAAAHFLAKGRRSQEAPAG
ncbi:helix-turn-helix domain-containing protein [Dissulfurirhabdus thermomarina]|uniref:Helix-turn-helix domain-containing protein n=1 Tax=Dissulfurirhabdus thermomarina TaxID=1765737 RepID=A0A6N9TP99_DISTH|nr:helix-turn-helix transcriptional regulator [Dissulfurirhabdus thermomarina]NDY41564.1 helix-turn-helix domain-containing protein [Dissulfurirhabdus thermomarina]NMX22381.1 helix-turn-helix domain-containing protein [Dissulfurirhabdus thermomarina]